MKTPLQRIHSAWWLTLALGLVAAGCSKQAESPATPATTEPAAAPATPPPASTAQPAPAPNTPAGAASALTEAARERASEVDAVVQGATQDAEKNAATATEALQAQARQLLAQYSSELATLQTGASNLKKLIDQHASMLPAGVSEKYQQLNTMLPKLGAMVESLKNYQTADLANLVPKLKADFAEAQKLYSEIKGMLPAA